VYNARSQEGEGWKGIWLSINAEMGGGMIIDEDACGSNPSDCPTTLRA